MKILERPEEMRAWSQNRRCAGETIGLVPTMGALHAGHESLMKQAVKFDDAVVVSIFVNPAQFAPHEDYDQYPRTFQQDVDIAESLGLHAVYAPKVSAMYPPRLRHLHRSRTTPRRPMRHNPSALFSRRRHRGNKTL